MKEITDVQFITALIREADQNFESVGGSTRHYVADVLLPLMEEKGICFCQKETHPVKVGEFSGKEMGTIGVNSKTGDFRIDISDNL